MAETNPKWKRLGNVRKKEKDGKTTHYITFGNKGNLNPEYDYSVELVVKNGTGKVVATVKDGLLSLFKSEESARKFAKTPEAAEKRIAQLKEHGIVYDIMLGS